jgi:formyl-CoA transferase
MADDAELATNPGRVRRVAEIDEAIAQWTSRHPVDVVVETLNAASVPVGRIYSAADIAADPHYRARDMILPVLTHDGLSVEVPGIIPKLSATPGAIVRRGPTLGEDTQAVLGALPSRRQKGQS